MKKFIGIMLLSLSCLAKGEELEFIMLRADCLTTHSDGEYEYIIGAVMKNISDKPITLVTSSIAPFIGSPSGKPDEFVFSISLFSKVNGVPLIPSKVDLKLVHINPGEAAAIGQTKKTSRAIDETRIVYSIADTYSDRFGYWSGSIESEYIEVRKNNECKL